MMKTIFTKKYSDNLPFLHTIDKKYPYGNIYTTKFVNKLNKLYSRSLDVVSLDDDYNNLNIYINKEVIPIIDNEIESSTRKEIAFYVLFIVLSMMKRCNNNDNRKIKNKEILFFLTHDNQIKRYITFPATNVLLNYDIILYNASLFVYIDNDDGFFKLKTLNETFDFLNKHNAITSYPLSPYLLWKIIGSLKMTGYYFCKYGSNNNDNCIIYQKGQSQTILMLYYHTHDSVVVTKLLHNDSKQQNLVDLFEILSESIVNSKNIVKITYNNMKELVENEFKINNDVHINSRNVTNYLNDSMFEINRLNINTRENALPIYLLEPSKPLSDHKNNDYIIDILDSSSSQVESHNTPNSDRPKNFDSLLSDENDDIDVIIPEFLPKNSENLSNRNTNKINATDALENFDDTNIFSHPSNENKNINNKKIDTKMNDINFDDSEEIIIIEKKPNPLIDLTDEKDDHVDDLLINCDNIKNSIFKYGKQFLENESFVVKYLSKKIFSNVTLGIKDILLRYQTHKEIYDNDHCLIFFLQQFSGRLQSLIDAFGDQTLIKLSDLFYNSNMILHYNDSIYLGSNDNHNINGLIENKFVDYYCLETSDNNKYISVACLEIFYSLSTYVSCFFKNNIKKSFPEYYPNLSTHDNYIHPLIFDKEFTQDGTYFCTKYASIRGDSANCIVYKKNSVTNMVLYVVSNLPSHNAVHALFLIKNKNNPLNINRLYEECDEFPVRYIKYSPNQQNIHLYNHNFKKMIYPNMATFIENFEKMLNSN